METDTNKFDETQPYCSLHRPKFVDSSTPPEKFNFLSVDMLLNELSYKKTENYFWCFSERCNYDTNRKSQYLMIQSNDYEKWWVIGFIYNFDLSKYLPLLDTDKGRENVQRENK